MEFIVVVSLLCAVASAAPLDFHPSLHSEHPAFTQQTKIGRIVGGEEVPPHRAPYQVALFLGDNFCGGSLISDRYVLTSAQCASLSNRPVVVLGAHYIKQNEKEQMSFVASKIIFHPHWNRFENDIALIMLPQVIKFTDAVRPIAMAPPNSGTFEKEQARITGWGITHDGGTEMSPVLRYILNPIVSNSLCESRFGFRLNPGQMCLSGESKRSPCKGDGGAPVVAMFKGNLVQIGIVSFLVEGACERGYPVGLTKVSNYYNWIVSSM